jgi:antitoxin ParD1/3/4
MGTRNVNLTDRFDKFIDKKVAEGKFSNASEVVRAGLALLEKQEEEDAIKLSALRQFAQRRFAALDADGGVRVAGKEQLQHLLDAMEARLTRDERDA